MSDGVEGMHATALDVESGSQAARSYAQALLGAAEGAGRVAEVLDDLDELIADVWQARPEFARLLRSPTLATTEKDRILAEAFEGRAEPLLVRFLRVLNRHGRLDLLAAIAAQARSEWERRHGRRRVTVRSAVPLDEDQVLALRETLVGIVRAEPEMRFEVDPALLGGLVVQVGDDLYDGSIRSRLQRVHRRLLEQKMSELRRNRDAFTIA